MNHFVEEESGSLVPRARHPHNGYYAGDFSAVPYTAPDLSVLLPPLANAA
jgi:hypothetical protein